MLTVPSFNKLLRILIMKKKLIFITILILLVIFMIINILREELINVVIVNDVGKMKPYDILFYDNYYNNNYLQ